VILSTMAMAAKRIRANALYAKLIQIGLRTCCRRQVCERERGRERTRKSESEREKECTRERRRENKRERERKREKEREREVSICDRDQRRSV